ncbi:MAG: hypothetical protein ABI867_03300 [Kofleriaceae bacterium]
MAVDERRVDVLGESVRRSLGRAEQDEPRGQCRRAPHAGRTLQWCAGCACGFLLCTNSSPSSPPARTLRALAERVVALILARMQTTGLAVLGCFLATTTAVAAAPVKGTFAFTGYTDGTKTVVYADQLKAQGLTGEALISFDGETMTIGAWAASKQDKRPDNRIVPLCRAKTSFKTTWIGNSFSVPSEISLDGWSDGFLMNDQKTGNTTLTTYRKVGSRCGHTLAKGTFTVTVLASDANGATILEMKAANVVFRLKRTIAIEDMDGRAHVDKHLID